MLRECFRHESLASIVMHSDDFYLFFEYVEVPTFDISSDAFSTFKVILYYCIFVSLIWLQNSCASVFLCLYAACHFVHQLHHAIGASRHQRSWEAKEDVVRMCKKWYDYMQPGWCQPVRQEFMENECEALPGVAYPGVRDNRSTLNTKSGYDDEYDDDIVANKWAKFGAKIFGHFWDIAIFVLGYFILSHPVCPTVKILFTCMLKSRLNNDDKWLLSTLCSVAELSWKHWTWQWSSSRNLSRTCLQRRKIFLHGEELLLTSLICLTIMVLQHVLQTG